MKITDLLLTADKTYSEVLEVTGTLTLDPNKSITITTNKNIIAGKLVSKPVYPNVHTIRFTNIDESKFVGGGMDVLDSDVGLWVMGSGQLDLEGPKRTGWTRPTVPIKSGDISFTAVDATGWQVGDEIVAMPTAPNAQNYDERKIVKIEGSKITVDRAFTDHPQIAGFPMGEIANLTRNIRIEGTASGRSHVFIHSTAKQNISGVSFRYMGPRKTQQGMANSLVAGRYGLHFHHSEDGSRGTKIDSVVVRDSGSHCFVPHGSHGITFFQCVGYNSLEDQYWYDLNHSTHDLTYDECLAAKASYVPRSLDMDLWAIDQTDKTPTLGANGFLLGRGDGNTIKNCVVVGTVGDPHAKAGYLWPTRSETQPEGVWNAFNNIAHNCNCGSLTWQNTQLNHIISLYFAYSNGLDLFHGAYQNNYQYEKLKCNGLSEFKAASGDRLRIVDSEFGTVNLLGSALDSYYPMQFINCKWNNWVDAVGESVHGADLIDCEGLASVTGLTSEIVRVQPKSGQPYRLTRSGKTNISKFAPSLWGKGTGLKGEYFSDPNFTNKVFERTDAVIAFTDWGNLVHHLIPGTKFSVRWTGKLLAQWTETHTFSMGGGGNMKLWINGQQLNKVNLIAGQFYDIRIEFFNNDDNVRGGAYVLWSSPSILLSSPKGEFIPPMQLYPTAPTPPANQAPKANAGTDLTITLPINSTVLTGSATDADGAVTRYAWTKESGPAAFSIVSPTNPSTQITGLTEGSYVFKLTVTDDKGATSSDTVTVVVKPAIVPDPNKPPAVQVSTAVNVITTATILLNGAGVDPEGGPLTYQWSQVAGPSVIIQNAGTRDARVLNAPAGTYRFKLRVVDNQGATAEIETGAITF